MSNRISGTVKSEKGFYIGDLCYALDDEIYNDVWGGAGYEDGIYTEPVTGLRFAVAGTAYGDGTYEDDYGREYDVDAGNIALVPAELAEDTEGGHYFQGAGEAKFEAEKGFFEITLPNGDRICIGTDESYDAEDDYYEEDEWEEDDEYEE